MMRRPTQPQVVVVGAGVVGLCTALFCARRGMRVSVVERNPAQRDGCSFGNAGMIVPSHFVPLAAPGMVAAGMRWMCDPTSPFYIKPRLDLDLLRWAWRFWRAATPQRVAAAAPVLRDLSLLSLQGFDELNLDMGMEKHGLLMLCRRQQTLDEEAQTAEMARRLGIPAEVLDARATAARDPAIEMNVCGSVYFPLDRHLVPARLMAALAGELQALGVEFHWQSDVGSIVTDGQRVRALRTTGGDVAGDEFVLCSGVWTRELGQSLKLRLPLQAGKGYSLTLANPPQLPTVCSICTEARLAATPMDGSLRFAGTMEMAGLDASITPSRVQGIIRAVTDYFPAFGPRDFADIQPWSGLRPVSPDGMPYLGRTRRWENLVVAAGHAMMGVSLAPATGMIVAGLLAGDQPRLPLELVSPDRFL